MITTYYDKRPWDAAIYCRGYLFFNTVTGLYFNVQRETVEEMMADEYDPWKPNSHDVYGDDMLKRLLRFGGREKFLSWLRLDESTVSNVEVIWCEAYAEYLPTGLGMYVYEVPNSWYSLDVFLRGIIVE